MTTPKSRMSLFGPLFSRHSTHRILLIGLLLALPLRDWAAADQRKPEKPYALIFGTVWGPDNRPRYAVKVKIRLANQKKARWELFSDHNGEFAQRVPAGRADYLVRVDLKDYKSSYSNGLQGGDETKVHIEGDERVDIGLHLK